MLYYLWNKPESLLLTDKKIYYLWNKPESLLLNHKKIDYLWKRPESLLLKGGRDTPQENSLRMLTRKCDRPFNQYR